MLEQHVSGIWLTTRDERRRKKSSRRAAKRKREKENYTLVGSYKVEGASARVTRTLQKVGSRSKLQTKISRFMLSNDDKEVEDPIEKIHDRDTCPRRQQLLTKQESVLQALEHYDLEKRDLVCQASKRDTDLETKEELQGSIFNHNDHLNGEIDEAWSPPSHSTEVSVSFPTDRSTNHLPFSESSNCHEESDRLLPCLYDPAFYHNCTEHNTQGETLPPITHSLIYQALGSPGSLEHGSDSSNQIELYDTAST
ncbi:uncharacterized protein LOC134196155 [Corticium candelabrum]|uniref:uncharacterized protein LOC134196155 n=1 Tax=Corticium candelabrum TaxID=121492 RepID=UPI002E265586|nr:uncharacterized protein LOC134196155 [Corticium candelabrum]